MHHLAGLFLIVPMSGLLTISFFVLFAIRKADNQALKGFGYVVCTLLWISASLLFVKGAFMVIKGSRPMMCHMMDKMKMERKMQGSMEEKMPGMKKGYGK